MRNYIKTAVVKLDFFTGLNSFSDVVLVPHIQDEDPLQHDIVTHTIAFEEFVANTFVGSSFVPLPYLKLSQEYICRLINLLGSNASEVGGLVSLEYLLTDTNPIDPVRMIRDLMFSVDSPKTTWSHGK